MDYPAAISIVYLMLKVHKTMKTTKTTKPEETGRAKRAVAGEATPSRRCKKSKGREYWYWVATVTIEVLPDGTRIRKDVSASTEEECQAKIDALIAQRSIIADIESKKVQYDPSKIKASKTTLQYWMRYWLQSIDGVVKPNTYSTYQAASEEHIIPGLGSTKLIDLNRPQIERWVKSLYNSKTGEPLSDTGKRYAALVLHIALQAAVDAGKLLTNPADNVMTPKANMDKYTPIEDNEMKRLILYVDDHSKYPQVIKVLLLTGMRKGEALGLSWDNVSDATDTKEGMILVKQQLQYVKQTHRLEITSVNKSREIYPPQMVMDILRDIKTEQAKQKADVIKNGGTWGNDWDLVFTHPDGRPVNPVTLYVDFKKCCEAVGLSNIRVHDLRHQYATSALANGFDVSSVNKTLGHASESYTLNKYVDPTRAMQQHASQTMDQYIAKIFGTQDTQKGTSTTAENQELEPISENDANIASGKGLTISKYCNPGNYDNQKERNGKW